MRILVVTTSYPVSRDGSEAAGSFVADFVSALNRQSDTTVVYPVAEKENGALSGFPFRAPRLPLSLLSPANPRDWIDILVTLRNGQSTLDKAVRAFKPDHIFALWVLPSGYWSSKTGKRHGVPFSVWALGSDIWALGKVPVVKGILKSVLRKSSHRFADGFQLRDDVARIAGMESHFLPSTRVLPVIGDSRSANIKRPWRLAFLGRWHKNKGIDVLMGALELLSDTDWSKIGEVRIFGGGPLKDIVKASAGRLLDRGKPIVVGGYMDTREAANLLVWADYLMIPSRIESIPVIFSDALQAGTPMVVSPVGDFPKLFAQNPPGVIAQEVSSCHFHDALRKALGASPTDFSSGIFEKKEVFDIDRSVRTLLSHFCSTAR